MKKESNNKSQLSFQTTATMVCPECGYITRDNVTNCPECGCPAKMFVPMAPVSDNALDVVEYDLESICRENKERNKQAHEALVQKIKKEGKEFNGGNLTIILISTATVFLVVIFLCEKCLNSFGLVFRYFISVFVSASLLLLYNYFAITRDREKIQKKYNLSDEEYEKIKNEINKEIEERNKRQSY